MIVAQILIAPKISRYLNERGLLSQFNKAKDRILDGNYHGNQLRLRKPKNKWVYYFRINKQFRAWWKLEWKSLYVFRIDNHQ